MTEREALKLALEALEAHADIGIKSDKAITAIKEALAQPEQEPVAWLNEEKKIIYWHNTHETDDYHGFKRTTPLYTTPPQRKPLTDEEIRKANHHMVDGAYDYSFKQGVKWAEYKHGIKENT